MGSTVEVLSNAGNGGPTMPLSPVMDLKAAAVYLNSTVGWVRQQIYAGNLSYQRIGKKHIVRRSEVEALLNRGWRRNGT